MRSFALLACAALFACGTDVADIPDPPVDAGIECGAVDGGTLSCPGDQICVAGRCYEPCTTDSQCGPSQACEDGFCVTGERTDAGPPDAGLCPDGCESPTAICHPSGTCVACTSSGECEGAAAPLCDVAFGECLSFAAGGSGGECSPCGVDADCVDGRSCRARDGEQVCLTACDAENPCTTAGYACGADGFCAPSFGTCTGRRSAANGRSCGADADCEPLGATPPAGVCRGADADAGVGGTCVQACAETTDCRGGYECTSGYCEMIPVAI